MKFSKRKIGLGFFGVLVFLISVLSILYLVDKGLDAYVEESVYLINTKNNELTAVPYKLDENKTDEENVIDMYNYMATYTDEGSFLKSISPDVKLLDSYILNTTLYLNLSDDYNVLSGTQKATIRDALVWSMTSLSYIDDVIIRIDGVPIMADHSEEEYALNRNNVLLNPVFSPSRILKKSIVLYFPKDDKTGNLYTEIREVLVSEETSEEKAVIEELLKGSTIEGTISAIPKDTKLREIITNNGICQIDLSEDFITGNSKDPVEQVASVYSVVNSLTELKHITKVQFLIESKKTNGFDAIDISQPLSRNIDYVE